MKDKKTLSRFSLGLAMICFAITIYTFFKGNKSNFMPLVIASIILISSFTYFFNNKKE
jgi:putative effector of murein hydrolase